MAILARRVEAIAHEVRAPSVVPAYVFVQLALPMPDRIRAVATAAALGPVRSLRPPLPLRI